MLTSTLYQIRKADATATGIAPGSPAFGLYQIRKADATATSSFINKLPTYCIKLEKQMQPQRNTGYGLN